MQGLFLSSRTIPVRNRIRLQFVLFTLSVLGVIGDCLHFGLATQQARAQGVKNIDMIMVTDDVAIPRSAGKLVGRRAIGGTTLGESKVVPPNLDSHLPVEFYSL